MSFSAFELRPFSEGQTDAAWASSAFRGACRVVASSASRARFWAAGAFTCSLAENPGMTAPSPWLRPSLVHVEKLETYLGPYPLEEGTILLESDSRLSVAPPPPAALHLRRQPLEALVSPGFQRRRQRPDSLCLVLSQAGVPPEATSLPRPPHLARGYGERPATLRITLPGCDLTA